MHILEELKVRLRFRRKMGKWGRISHPELFSEKQQWLKLHYRNPLYTTMADKYAVKEYVDSILGPGYTIPTIAVYDRAEDIRWETLPDRFVIKCTHDSGGVRICRDKSSFDKEEAVRFLSKRLRLDYSRHKSEWTYKDVPHRIIVEQYLSEGPETDLHGIPDYKFMCFGGKPHSVMVCVDRGIGEVKYYFFDRQWNLLRINEWSAAAPEGFTLPRPGNLDEMFDLAARLSAGIPFVRVDLYSVAGRIWFGEFTFFPKSGLDMDLLPSTDVMYGRMFDLPEANL